MEPIADRGQNSVERDKLHGGLDGRQILDTRTTHDVAARGGDQLVAQLGISGGPPCGSGLRFPAALLALPQAIVETHL